MAVRWLLLCWAVLRLLHRCFRRLDCSAGATCGAPTVERRGFCAEPTAW